MYRFNRVVILFGVMVISLTVNQAMAQCVVATPQLEHMQQTQIRLQNNAQEWIAVNTHVADEPAESSAGFQHICQDTIDNTFILFVYSRPYLGRFHMQNVYGNLDIAFIREDGVVISIQQMRAEPPGLPVKPQLYSPPEPFMFALEAREGFFADNDIKQMQSRFDVDAFLNSQ